MGTAIAVLCGGATAAAASELAAALEFARDTYDFGSVPQGDTIQAEFPFANRGVVPLTVSPPIAACECTAELAGAGDLAPGDEGVVRVTCDTSRMAGSVRRTVTVHSSEVSRRSILLTIRGEVEVDVISDPAEVYLGPVVRGQRVDNAFAIRLGYDGARSTSLRGAGTSGPYIDIDWQNGDVTFAVTILADAPLGTFTQNVTIATNSRRFPTWQVPVTGTVLDTPPRGRW